MSHLFFWTKEVVQNVSWCNKKNSKKQWNKVSIIEPVVVWDSGGPAFPCSPSVKLLCCFSANNFFKKKGLASTNGPETYTFWFPVESTPLLALSSHRAKTFFEKQTTAIVTASLARSRRRDPKLLTTKRKCKNVREKRWRPVMRNQRHTRTLHMRLTRTTPLWWSQPPASRSPGSRLLPFPGSISIAETEQICVVREITQMPWAHGAPRTATHIYVSYKINSKLAKATRHLFRTTLSLAAEQFKDETEFPQYTMLTASPSSHVKPQPWAKCRTSVASSSAALLPPPAAGRLVAVESRRTTTTVASAALGPVAAEPAEGSPVPQVRVRSCAPS